MKRSLCMVLLLFFALLSGTVPAIAALDGQINFHQESYGVMFENKSVPPSSGAFGKLYIEPMLSGSNSADEYPNTGTMTLSGSFTINSDSGVTQNYSDSSDHALILNKDTFSSEGYSYLPIITTPTGTELAYFSPEAELINKAVLVDIGGVKSEGAVPAFKTTAEQLALKVVPYVELSVDVNGLVTGATVSLIKADDSSKTPLRAGQDGVNFRRFSSFRIYYTPDENFNKTEKVTFNSNGADVVQGQECKAVFSTPEGIIISADRVLRAKPIYQVIDQPTMYYDWIFRNNSNFPAEQLDMWFGVYHMSDGGVMDGNKSVPPTSGAFDGFWIEPWVSGSGNPDDYPDGTMTLQGPFSLEGENIPISRDYPNLSEYTLTLKKNTDFSDGYNYLPIIETPTGTDFAYFSSEAALKNKTVSLKFGSFNFEEVVLAYKTTAEQLALKVVPYVELSVDVNGLVTGATVSLIKTDDATKTPLKAGQDGVNFRRFNSMRVHYSLDGTLDNFESLSFRTNGGDIEQGQDCKAVFLAPEGTVIRADRFVSAGLGYQITDYLTMMYMWTFRNYSNFAEPVITTINLADGTVGEAYSVPLTATGAAPITWTAGADMPGGLSLNGTTGVISGTPTAAGTFSIAVSAKNAVSSDTKIINITVKNPPVVIVPVTGVTLSSTSATLNAGTSQTITETVLPSNASNKSVIWSSNNTSVATVENGVITGVNNGTAEITVTTVDGSKTASCMVAVNKRIDENTDIEIPGSGGQVTVPPGTEIKSDGTMILPTDRGGAATTSIGINVSLPGGTEIKPDGTIILSEGKRGEVSTSGSNVTVTVSGDIKLESGGEIVLADAAILTVRGIMIILPNGNITESAGTNGLFVKAAEQMYISVVGSDAKVTLENGSTETVPVGSVIEVSPDGSIKFAEGDTSSGDGSGCSACCGLLALFAIAPLVIMRKNNQRL